MILLNQRSNQVTKFLVTRWHIVTTRARHNPHCAHHSHLRIQLRQGSLHLTKLIVPRNIPASRRPNLENVVGKNVRIILLPRRRHIHKVLLVKLIVIVPVWSPRPLILLTLMPKHRPYPMRQLRRHHPIKKIRIDRIPRPRQPMPRWVRLMLINSRPPHRSVDHADRDVQIGQ